MEFRRLNEAGIAAFRDYLNRLRAEPTLSPPLDLLTNPATSEPLAHPIAAEPEPFANRMAFAKWLHSAAAMAGRSVPQMDVGFWGWLTLLLLDQVCPPSDGGRRKVNEEARYVPMLIGARRYYRHAL